MVKLLWKEMILTVKSITYWLIVGVIMGFMLMQLGTDVRVIREPQRGDEEYGMTVTTDLNAIQERTYASLLDEYEQGEYSTYPFGFVKNIVLKSKQSKQIQNILEGASGKSIQELGNLREQSLTDRDGTIIVSGQQTYTFPIKEGRSYQSFEKDMKRVTKLLGSGSDYEKSVYSKATMVDRTYEQALKDYQAILKKDQVVGAYARLICDYLGIILGVMPAFLAVTVILRDKRSQAEQVIFSRRISSSKLLFSRYLSVVLLLSIATILISLMPGGQAMAISEKLGISGNMVLFLKYVLSWAMPSILFLTGFSFLLTELFGGIAALSIQMVFWLLSIFVNGRNLLGSVGINLIPRFNKLGEREVFDQIFSELVLNRLVYAGLGLLFLGLTIAVFNYRRNGGQGAWRRIVQ